MGVAEVEGVRGAVGEAVAAVGARVGVADDSLVDGVDGDAEAADEVLGAFDLGFLAGEFEEEVSFALGVDLGAEDVDLEVIVSDESADDGGVGLALGEVEEVLVLGDHGVWFLLCQVSVVRGRPSWTVRVGVPGAAVRGGSVRRGFPA